MFMDKTSIECVNHSFSKLECGGVIDIPTDGSRTVGSPNFPYNYFNNLDCYYQINGAPSRRIEVNFLEFTTEPRQLDPLSIGEGCLEEAGDIIVGDHSGYGVPPPGRFFSRLNSVWMRFHTSEVGTYKGWLINFADATTPAGTLNSCQICASNVSNFKRLPFCEMQYFQVKVIRHLITPNISTDSIRKNCTCRFRSTNLAS